MNKHFAEQASQSLLFITLSVADGSAWKFKIASHNKIALQKPSGQYHSNKQLMLAFVCAEQENYNTTTRVYSCEDDIRINNSKAAVQWH